jgi:hypothetical protein
LHFSGYNLQSLAVIGAWLDLSKLSHLAIQYYSGFSTLRSASQILTFLEQCPSLRTLKIVIACPPDDPWLRDYERYCFLEVDNTFDSIMTWSPDANDRDNSQIPAQLQRCMNILTLFRANFSDNISDDEKRWSRVDWKVCVVRFISGECDGEGYDTVCLVPTEPKYHSVSYYTRRTQKRACGPESEHYIWVEALGCYAACDHGGNPYTCYDGEAMQKLFEEAS